MPTAAELPGVIDTTKQQGRSQEFVSEGDKRVGSATVPAGYRALGGVSGKAPRKPKIILKISLNVKNFILFRGKISTWQFRRGTCPPGPLPYAPGV